MKKPNILVVDHHDRNRALTISILKKANYTVAGARDEKRVVPAKQCRGKQSRYSRGIGAIIKNLQDN